MTPLATPLSLVSFVSVDVETTGLDPYHDHIVEIGAVKVQGGKAVDQWDTLVSIDRSIPWDARRVHGINNEMLVGKPCINEALEDLFSFLGDGVLVEHSHKAFDVIFLEQAHGRPLTVPYINTCTLSRKLFPFFPKHSLNECCRRHKVENPRPHRALGDATATAGLLIRFLDACGPRYPRLEDLMKIASVQR